MNIVQPYAKIISPISGIEMLQSIERAARISHRSEDAATDASYEKFIEFVVMKRCDWSVVEHVGLSCEFLVDRGITHELVRHRLFSYTQESTRFVNYTQGTHPPAFIYPCNDHAHEKDGYVDPRWREAMEFAESAYRDLLLTGWRPQEARSVLPNALAAKIEMTGNLRSWRWFFLMRTTKETHPQMKQVTIPLLAEFKSRIPILFDDIEPNQSQSVSARMGH